MYNREGLLQTGLLRLFEKKVFFFHFKRNFKLIAQHELICKVYMICSNVHKNLVLIKKLLKYI